MGESNSIPVRPAIQVAKIQWDRREVKREDIVTMMCQFESGVRDDDEATVVIYEHNPNSCDFKASSIPTTIKSDRIELQWEFDYQDGTGQIPTDEELKPYQKKYAIPQYYFMALVDGVRIGDKRESGLMAFVDKLTLECPDNERDIPSDLSYMVHMADGKELTGSFGPERKITFSEVRPGPLNIIVK
jgi:hypothetical protein